MAKASNSMKTCPLSDQDFTCLAAGLACNISLLSNVAHGQCALPTPLSAPGSGTASCRRQSITICKPTITNGFHNVKLINHTSSTGRNDNQIIATLLSIVTLPNGAVKNIGPTAGGTVRPESQSFIVSAKLPCRQFSQLQQSNYRCWRSPGSGITQYQTYGGSGKLVCCPASYCRGNPAA